MREGLGIHIFHWPVRVTMVLAVISAFNARMPAKSEFQVCISGEVACSELQNPGLLALAENRVLEEVQCQECLADLKPVTDGLGIFLLEEGMYSPAEVFLALGTGGSRLLLTALGRQALSPVRSLGAGEGHTSRWAGSAQRLVCWPLCVQHDRPDSSPRILPVPAEPLLSNFASRSVATPSVRTARFLLRSMPAAGATVCWQPLLRHLAPEAEVKRPRSLDLVEEVEVAKEVLLLGQADQTVLEDLVEVLVVAVLPEEVPMGLLLVLPEGRRETIPSCLPCPADGTGGASPRPHVAPPRS